MSDVIERRPPTVRMATDFEMALERARRDPQLSASCVRLLHAIAARANPHGELMTTTSKLAAWSAMTSGGASLCISRLVAADYISARAATPGKSIRLRLLSRQPPKSQKRE